MNASLFLAIAMLAVFGLTFGAVVLLRQGQDRRRGWMMLAAAFVLLANVLIWTL